MNDVALMDYSGAGWRGDNSQDALSLCRVAVLVRAGASQNKEGRQTSLLSSTQTHKDVINALKSQ